MWMEEMMVHHMPNLIEAPRIVPGREECERILKEFFHSLTIVGDVLLLQSVPNLFDGSFQKLFCLDCLLQACNAITIRSGMKFKMWSNAYKQWEATGQATLIRTTLVVENYAAPLWNGD